MTDDIDPKIMAARAAALDNRDAIQTATLCACYACGEDFAPAAIREWTDSDRTALCPYCGVDGVIPDVSGLPLTVDFLARCAVYWFSENDDDDDED
ncbi:MAG: hypothetical protein ABWZ40_07990 [Caulobacterales bacterium]